MVLQISAGAVEEVLVDHIRARTFRRIHDLEVRVDAERITVSGRTPGFFVKQLVIHAIFEVLNKLKLTQAVDLRITVGEPADTVLV